MRMDGVFDSYLAPPVHWVTVLLRSVSAHAHDKRSLPPQKKLKVSDKVSTFIHFSF